jgi:PhnB protein
MLPSDKRKSPISVMLVVDNIDAATDFYYRTFRALEQERYADATGKVWYAVIDVHGTPIQLMQPFDEMGHALATQDTIAAHGDSLVVNVDVEDTRPTFARGMKSGAEPIDEPTRASWGAEIAQFRDPFGHRWMTGSRLLDRDRAKAPVSVMVAAADVPGTVRFFSEVFGATKPVGHQGFQANDGTFAVTRIQGAPLQIVQQNRDQGLRPAGQGGRPGGDVSLLTVAFKDVEGASKRAVALGGESVLDPQVAYWGDNYTEFRSPEGLRVATCGEQAIVEVVDPVDAQVSFREFLEKNDNPSSPADLMGAQNIRT